MDTKNIVELVEKYVAILNKPKNNRFGKVFSYTTGKKYFKVIDESSVEAFVEKTTGDVYKPASWAAPAKNARYNLATDLNLLNKVIKLSSGYLYQEVVDKYTKGEK
jgi:hypothetical protein|tara:strand:- start:222 stop:539 length:318 start_codon:yes stop_codon:yes gene_type:complete